MAAQLFTHAASALRRLGALALAMVLCIGLAACDSGSRKAASLSADDIATIERQAEGFLAARDRLPELASPWLKRASCKQLAIATDGHHSTQLQGGGAASEAPKGSRHRPPHHHWGTSGAGHRGPASGQ